MRYFILILLFLSNNIHAKTITVCANCEVKTIKEAVTLAEDGDTVIVKAGLYQETNININKAITLQGEGTPIIDASNKKESIFAVTGENITISGFKLINVGMSYTSEIATIFLSKSKNVIIKDNIMENDFYALIVQASKYITLDHNIVSGQAKDEATSGNGFHLWKCKHITIINNDVSGMRDGIYLEYVNDSFIKNNVSHNNVRYGLHFMFSHRNEYEHNEFKKNGAGVAVMFSKHIIMHENIFHYNWGTASYGLLLKEIYDAEIYNNRFEQNTIGINIDGCNRINYKHNEFTRNGWALRFTGGCYENIFTANNFMHNAFDLAYNSRLNDNSFDGNYWTAYSGYDLDKNGIGDIPHRPVKLFSYVVNRTPEAMVLLHSLFVDIINFSEKVSPVFTPDNLKDSKPLTKPVAITFTAKAFGK